MIGPTSTYPTALTPVIQVSPSVFAKLEYLQIGNSHKARAAQRVIFDAETSGTLARHQGHVIMESTGGNFGLGLLAHARPLGYEVHLLVRPNFSAFRRFLLEQFGAVLFGQDEMRQNVLDNATIMANYREALTSSGCSVFYTDQFNNVSCVAAHHQAGVEYVRQLSPHVGADTQVFLVKCVGSGASLAGYHLAFSQAFGSRLSVVVAQPEGCDFRTATFLKNHPFDGISVGRVPPFFNPMHVDHYADIPHDEANAAVKEIRGIAGAFVGRSTGVAYAAAKRFEAPNRVLAFIAYDAGESYAADEFRDQT